MDPSSANWREQNQFRAEYSPEKRKKKKVARKRTAPHDALEKREQKKEATRREWSHRKKREKGGNDIKEEQVEKGLRTSSHKSSQKWKEPSKW